MDGLRAALFAKLNGDAALTDLLATTTSIFHRRAPQGTLFPYIVLQKQSGNPVWSFGGEPLDYEVWMVKGVDRAPSGAKAEDIRKQINRVLTDPVMNLSDGTLLYLRRESDIDYGEDSDPDQIVHHVGGLYRTVIDRA